MVNSFDIWLNDLVADARKEEVEEVAASHGTDIRTAAKDSLDRSEHYCAFYKDDKLLCLTGVIPYSELSDTAVPWMLSTNELTKHPRDLVYYSKQLIGKWLEEWPKLENYIDARYTKSLNWAKHVGFTIHDPMPYGVEGRLFHKITMEKK